MSNSEKNNNRNNETENTGTISKQNVRRPLPQGDIIGKRPEIFNLTYKNMFKRDDSSN